MTGDGGWCRASMGGAGGGAGVGGGGPGGGGGDLVPTMPGCVCPKVKDMGPFSASRKWNISLKMGAKIAASLNMGKNLC